MKSMWEWKHAKECRRGLAFMLAVAMVAVNILAGAGTAYATGPEGDETGNIAEVDYILDPSALAEAIEALKSEDGTITGTGVTLGDLREQYCITTDSAIGDDVTLYPLSISGEKVNSDYNTDMLVYYRPGAEESSDGKLSGKAVILFVNNEGESLRFKLTIGKYESTKVVMGMQFAAAPLDPPTVAPSESDPPTATPHTATPHTATQPTADMPSENSLPNAALFEIALKDLEHTKDSQYKRDIESLLDSVTITDDEGNGISGTLYVGKNYNIELHFSEKGSQYGQFDTESDTLTYQLPSIFKIDAQYGEELWIEGDTEPIGTYSVDENGLLTIVLNDYGKEKIAGSYDFTLSFFMSGTVEAVPAGSDGKVHFDSAGQEFTFEVVNQPIIDVEKDGKYTENPEKKGGTLEYTVRTTVEYGELHDTVVTDVLTPPQTESFKLNEATITEVKVKRADGTEVPLSSPQDYVWEKKKANPDHPGDLAFEIKLVGDYDPLTVDEELYVTYNYDVQYVEGATDVFWGNVLNEVTVTGHMPVDDPGNPGGTIDSPVEEKRNSNVEIYVTPSGHGVVCKAQDYSEADKTLHYTLYTVVPKGEWKPLYIYDDMYVEYNGERWYIPEFKENGLVKNLKVSAIDVPRWFEGWDDETGSAQKIQDMDKLRENAKELTGYNVSDTSKYDPASEDQYVFYLSGRTLFITFGYHGNNGEWNPWEWGEWNNETDRLIITEYDLDMSGEEEITLDDINGSETLNLTPAQILLAGITNNVFLRFGGYCPGFSVFFNNAEKMNKTGKLDPNTNTIEYTVSLNTTDKTVQKYFNDIKDDVYSTNKRLGVWGSEHYKGTMQAVFYDKLPEGWKYVEGSLYVTTRSKYGEEFIWDDLTNIEMATGQQGVLDSDGNISLPLAGVWGKRESGDMELFNYFGDDIMTQISFTYKLRATDKWLEEHALTEESIPVMNHAEIKDRNRPHWSADETVQYIPARLTKQAEQVEDTNLLKFTLQVNPYAKNYDPDKDYLIVSDKSNGIEIQVDSIVVTDAEKKPLTAMGPIAENAALSDNEWGLLPSNEDGKFRLKVPDEKALTISYNALICETGEAVQVSNEAELEGEGNYKSGYDAQLKVNRIWANAGGSSYSLKVEKVDKADSNKKLAGAKFNCYIVRKPDSTIDVGESDHNPISIGDKEYSIHFIEQKSTDEDGTFTLTDYVEPGNYYILDEIESPEGYMKPDEPILFYYGFENDIDNVNYPGALFVPGGGALTVTNEHAAYGDLKISKTIDVKGPANSFPVAEKTLHFDVEAVENAVTEDQYISGEVKLVDLNDTFDLYREEDKIGEITFDHGYADVTLTVKADEDWQNSVTIKGLPAGFYVVKESQYGVNVANYVWSVNNGFGSYKVTKDAPTEVTFTNTYTPDEGERPLRIIKTVLIDGQEDMSVKNEFTFTITGTTVSGVEIEPKTVQAVPGVYTDFIMLKPGHYVITETGDNKIDGYTFNGVTIEGRPNSWEFDLGAADGGTDNTITVEAYNNYTRDHGGLTITKTVEVEKPSGVSGISENLPEEYEFTIVGPADVEGTYDATITGTDKKTTEVTFKKESATATVQLKAGESITIKGLPTGNYTVVEKRKGAEVNGYTLTVTGEQSGDSHVSVGRNEFPSVNISNKYTLKTGDLQINKTVEIEDSANGFPVDEKTLIFDIEAIEEKVTEEEYIAGEAKRVPLNGEFDLVYANNTANGTAADKVTFVNGWTEIKLNVTKDAKWKNSATIKGLPTGVYVVKELQAGGNIQNYVWTVENGFGSYEVVEGKSVVSADITNIYSPDDGEIPFRITKVMLIDGNETTVIDREFTFQISGTTAGGENISPQNITLKPGETKEIKLKPGKYTITETGNNKIEGYTFNGVYIQGQPGSLSFELLAPSHNEADHTIAINAVNSYTTEKVVKTVRKVWDDKNDQDGLRPEKIRVQLLANGTASGDAVELNAANNWTYTWDGLPKMEDGKEISYTVVELDSDEAMISDNGKYDDHYTVRYADEGNTSTITNVHTPEVVSKTVTKVWADKDNQDGQRPERISVQLFANGKESGEPVELNAENGWSYTWTNLPKNAGGKEITYTVEEVSKVDGYKTTYSEDTFTITNTHKPNTVEKTVTKVWADNDDQDGVRPDSISVQLLADGEASGEPVELNAENGWSHTWTDLPKNAGGDEIVYTVAELGEVAGYTTAYSADTFTITNTHTPEEVEKTVTKVWADKDNQDGQRPERISVQLLANEKASGEPVELNAGNDWSHTWIDLPKNADGKEIIYTVEELGEAPGYTTAYSEDTFTITNTHEPDTVEKTVTKVWMDDDDQDGNRPTSIQVQLLADGIATGAPVELNADNGWSYKWEKLPKNDDGKEITYTVEELGEITGYTTSYNQATLTITNTYTPQLGSLTITKVVEGGVNETEEKEYTFTVTGPENYSTNVTITGNGSETLKDLKPGTYTVKEQDAKIEGYKLKVTGEGEVKVEAGKAAAKTVTNTYTPDESTEPSTEETKPTEPTEPETTAPSTEPTETSPENPTQPSPENPTQPSPENPTEPSPENPTVPNTPSGGNPTPTISITPPAQTEGIPDNTPPLNSMPTIENVGEVPTPLSSFRSLENIEDEDVPLAFIAPMTGDETPVGVTALFGLIALGMMGAFGIRAFRKDDDEA